MGTSAELLGLAERRRSDERHESPPRERDRFVAGLEAAPTIAGVPVLPHHGRRLAGRDRREPVRWNGHVLHPEVQRDRLVREGPVEAQIERRDGVRRGRERVHRPRRRLADGEVVLDRQTRPASRAPELYAYEVVSDFADGGLSAEPSRPSP